MDNRVVQANHNILKYHPLFHMTRVEAAKQEQSVGGGSSKAVSFRLKSIIPSGKLLEVKGSPCLLHASKDSQNEHTAGKAEFCFLSSFLFQEIAVLRSGNFQNSNLTSAFSRDYTEGCCFLKR